MRACPESDTPTGPAGLAVTPRVHLADPLRITSPAVAIAGRVRTVPFADQGWLDHVIAEVKASKLRPIGQKNLIKIARGIVECATWGNLRSRPTLARLVEVTGVCLRTVQRWTRWLEGRGWLCLIEPGSCPDFPHSRYRRRALDGETTNLAREWRLTFAHRSVTPSHPLQRVPSNAGTRDVPQDDTAGQDPGLDGRSAPGSSAAPPLRLDNATERTLARKPQRRGEMLEACMTLRARHMVLRRLSARRLRRILSPWFRSPWAWSLRGVLDALNAPPGGMPHRYATEVNDPERWLRWRMSFWLQADGTPGPAPRDLLEAAGQARLAQLGPKQLAEIEALRQAHAGVLEPVVSPVSGPAEVAHRGAELARALMRSRLVPQTDVQGNDVQGNEVAR